MLAAFFLAITAAPGHGQSAGSPTQARPVADAELIIHPEELAPDATI